MNRWAARICAMPAMCAAACTGSLFHSSAMPPTAYMLAAQPASPRATPAREIPVDLAVLAPKARPGLESDRIAVLYPDRRLDYYADARWSGPLGDVLQDLAVQVFQAHAGVRTVSAESSVFPSAYWLELEVSDFQAEYASAGGPPSVHVRLLARLGSSGDRRVIGRFTADSLKPAAENRISSIVDAFARAADASLADIVAQAAAVLADTSEVR